MKFKITGWMKLETTKEKELEDAIMEAIIPVMKRFSPSKIESKIQVMKT